MKKIISLILAVLCIVLTFCSCTKVKDDPATTTNVAGESADADVYTSGDYNYVKLSDGTAKIVKYKGSSSKTDIDIPASLDGFNVTVIGEKVTIGKDVAVKAKEMIDEDIKGVK